MEKITEININGTDYSIAGESAYEIAVRNGFEGTEEEWLNSLTEGSREYAESVVREVADDIVGEVAEGVAEEVAGRVAVEAVSNQDERISRNDKRITNLEQGIVSSPFETDNAIAYIKNVPANALPYAEISKVGGMTYRDEGVLKSAKITKIESVGVNLFDKNKVQNATETATGFSFINANGEGTAYTVATQLKEIAPTLKVGDTIAFYLDPVNTYHREGMLHLEGSNTDWFSGTFHTITEADLNNKVLAYGMPNKVCEYKDLIFTKIENAPFSHYKYNALSIPDAVQNRNSYGAGVNGDECNYIDFEHNVFVKKCAEIVFDGSEDEEWNIHQFTNLCVYIAPFANKQLSSVVCDRFDTLPYMTVQPDGTIGVAVEGIDAQTGGVFFGIRGLNISTVEGWRANLASNPITVVVSFVNADIIDISNILSADNYIEVESGGTITMVNEHGLDVPSEITYMLKEDAV